MFLTVRYNYGGNWTALFCIRTGMPRAAFLESENLYIFQNSGGYDGQVFHLIAHDPLMRKGSREAIAGAAFRYQRIFVPALAWMFALGTGSMGARGVFRGDTLDSVFLGVYWTSHLRLAARARARVGDSTFALTPAAITSIDG